MKTLPTTPHEAITMVGELLSDPARWMPSDHRHDARDAANRPVDPLCPSAVAWTLDGALARVIAADAVGQFDDHPEWARRIEVEQGAYRALGIAPGHEFAHHGRTMAVLRRALGVVFKAEPRQAFAA